MKRQKCKMQNQLWITALTVVLFAPCFPSFAEESMLQAMELQSMEKEFQTLVKSVQPSVVKVTATCPTNVSNVWKYNSSIGEKQYRSRIGKNRIAEHHEKIGSGILIDDAGHIATTVAVVEGRNRD